MHQILGIVACVAGGIGVGVFALPLKYSKGWAWENSWLVGTFFMFLVLPLVEAWSLVPNFVEIFRAANARDIWMIFVFGLIQGTGALAFVYGLTIMGLSLGYSLMVSLNAVFGVMVPLVIGHPEQCLTTGGITLMLGVVLLIVGVYLSAKAGGQRERAAGAQAKVRHFGLAVLIAVYSGLANSFFYFSFEFQKGLRDIAIGRFGVKDSLWPVANVVPLFAGMFAVTLVYCVAKMAREGTLRNYWSATSIRREYVLAIAIGVIWFLGQGICYTTGFTMLGKLGVPVGAAIFMSAAIAVSNLLGLRTGEWKAADRSTVKLLYSGIIAEILAIAIIGLGNHVMLAGEV